MEPVADTRSLASLLLLLAATPVMIFVAHAAAFRALRAAGARPTAHSSALAALAGAFAAVGAVAWAIGTTACGVLYTAIVFAAVGVLYIDVVNIAETSLHMHLLLELRWSGGADLAEVLDRYSADRMIAARLERLTSIGQICVVDGRCSIGDRSALRLARVVDAWRIVLGLPTAPPQTIENEELRIKKASPDRARASTNS
jgi:hypothetical protein